MTLKLAQYKSVEVVASQDGLLLQGPASADLSSRRGWPADALASPDASRLAREVEQALEMGLATGLANSVLIPNESFPQMRRRGLRITECFSEWAPLLLKIERINDIGRPEFKYRYSFLYESSPIAFDRVGYFGTILGHSQIYRVDDQTFALVSEMERFNALQPREKGRSESWLAFSKVKECAIDVGARLDGYLLSNDVIVPRQLNLEVHTWEDGSISFAPQVAGLDGPGLKRAFFNNPHAQDFYSVDGPDRSRVRVVFDERQAEALERMKTVHHARGERRAQSLTNPEAIFEGLLDVVEVRYGRRVTGIGSIVTTANSPVPRTRSVLEGGFSTSAPTTRESTVNLSTAVGETVEMPLEDSTAKQDLIAAATNAIDSGATSFTFEDREFVVDSSIRAYLNEQSAQIDRGDGVPRPQKNDAYLLPYQDDEDLKSWDVKDAEDARQACEPSIGYVLPSTLKSDVFLKTHQLDGLAWLQTCHRLRPSRRGSLLADDMGLGKILQILAYLAWCIEHDRELGLSSQGPPWRPILVVLPLILLESNTWENEISARFRGGVFDPILVLHGDKVKELRTKTVGKETNIGKPLIPASEFSKYRVVITNYQTLTNYQHSFAQLIPNTQKSIWSVLITDEAQEYKSPSTKISHALKALHPEVHIACTGTPVENRLLDLWNLIDTVQPALLGTSKYFSAKYERSAGDAAERLRELKQSLLFNTPNAFVLRRNKADVLSDLPPKTFEPLYSEMTDWEVRTHQELLDSVHGGSPLKILHKLVALYQHPTLIREDGGLLEPKKLLAESSKLRSVIDLLKRISRQGEKCVIFAYRISMQQILASVIESEFGLSVDIVNGSTEKSGGVDAGSLGSQQARRTRSAMLDRFRNTRGFNVIILSPFVASIGLTVTEANHVIHYGRWWNPAVEAQATDRVYRIGQTRPVHVHLPILRDSQGRLSKSFDENLHELIEEKQLQAENFLSPLPDESRIGAELFGKLKGDAPLQDLSEPISAESVDQLPHHLFEALVALLLEKQGYKTILTARSNDAGADAIAFREGELWLVQAKHTKKDGLINSVAMGDLMAASQTYSKPLSYSLHLLAVTNGNFAGDTKNEAARNGIRLLDRHKLMTDLRMNPITLGAVYAREDDRCRSFADGVRATNRWFA